MAENKSKKAQTDSKRHKEAYAPIKAANEAKRAAKIQQKEQEKRRKNEEKLAQKAAKLAQHTAEKERKEEERRTRKLAAEEAAKLRSHPDGLAGLIISQAERDQKLTELDTGVVKKVYRPILPKRLEEGECEFEPEDEAEGGNP